MKATAIVYGGILAMLIIASFAILYVTATGEVKRGIVSSEGKMITFAGEASLILKTFDQGLEFISSRAAYELGKNGGFYNYPQMIWNYNYPKLSFLEDMLEDKIGDGLPISETVGDRTINWREGEADVRYCDPLDNSICFNFNGSRNFSIYDRALTSMISEKHKFDLKVASSYFKLLYVGREIMENTKYNSTLNDANKLKNLLETDFPDLDFYITEIGNESIEIVIEDICYPETYCLAPLTKDDHIITEKLHSEGDFNWDGVIDKKDEEILNAADGSTRGDPNWNSACDLDKNDVISGNDLTIFAGNFWKQNPSYLTDPLNGKKIPYDYTKLKFLYKESQTGSTALISDFSIRLIPISGSIKSGEKLNVLVRVNSLGGDPNLVSLSSNINPAPTPAGSISVQFTPANGKPTYFSVMEITTDINTLAKPYTITVIGIDNIGNVRSADFALSISPSMFFHLEANPPSGIVLPGDPKSTTIDVVLDSGTASAVSLSVPQGVRRKSDGALEPSIGVSLSQPSCTPSPPSNRCSVTMTITTQDTTPDTDYEIEVVGIGGGSMETVKYDLKVAPKFKFKLELSPDKDRIVPGATSSPTVSVIEDCSPPPCLLKKPVTLSVSGVTYTKDGSVVSSKFSISFTENNKDPTYSSRMDVTNSSPVSDGDYVISIDGNGGGWSAGASFRLNITTPRCYNDGNCDDKKPCTGGDITTGIDKCINAGTVNAWCNQTNFKFGYIPPDHTTPKDCGYKTETCQDKCNTTGEYKGGSTETCYIECDGAGNCLPSCTPKNCTYSTSRKCRFGCASDNINCTSGKYCYPRGGWQLNGGVCGDVPEGTLCDGGECWVYGQCIRTTDLNPICQWQDLWWACLCGIVPCCCSEWKTCTATVCNANVNCKYPASCGNGICEQTDGETRSNCPGDCPCSFYGYEPDHCTAQGCKWCPRCNGNKENNLGTDACIEPAANCLYGCSFACGASCVTNSDCVAPSDCETSICKCMGPKI